MRKLILVFIAISIICLNANAQQFKKELIGKFLPAKVKFSDGKVTDVLMRYQPPQFFRNPNNKFRMVIPGVSNDTITRSGGIEAFMIDYVIWALRPSPTAEPSNSLNFVVLNRQGAIEEYDFMTSTLKSESDFNPLFNPHGTMTTKVGTTGKMASEMAFADGKDKQLRLWMSDSPEIMKELLQADSLTEIAKSLAEAKKLKESQADNEGVVKEEKAKPKGFLAKLEAAQKKEAAKKAAPVTPTSTTTDLTLIVNNYNAWYEQKNPGKIKYYFVDPPVHMKSPLEDFQDRQAEQEAYVKSEKVKSDAKKQIDDLYANRATTPSPEMASAKDNVPVKKETFGAKSSRIKSDGNKIGVLLYLEPARTIKPQTGSVQLISQVVVEGDYMDETLRAAGQQLVDELNQAYKTTDFELIDLSRIPYREVKVLGSKTRVDDWWASKYKVVFGYSLDPRLDATNESTGQKAKYAVSLHLLQSLIVTEYIGGPGSTKQDILTQVMNFGTFQTPIYVQEAELKDPKEMYEKSLEKLGMPVLDKMKSERAEGVAKLVEKKLTP